MTTLIRPMAAAVDPAGPPPTFIVRTDLASWEVEVATDPLLFDGALASRRAPRNFCSSGSQPTRRVNRFGLPRAAWLQLSWAPALFYRARGRGSGSSGGTYSEVTVPDRKLVQAPSVHVGRLPVGSAPPSRLSGDLPWLRTAGNAVIDSFGTLVVLRGMNHGAFEVADEPRLPAEDVKAMLAWGANVVRLPIQQHAVLTDRRYVDVLDDAIRRIATRGAYVLLALRHLDAERSFGTVDGGPNPLAALPEENTVRMWRALAARYRTEPSVLFDVFTAPHRPLPDDATAVFAAPPDEVEWATRWAAWARRVVLALHRVHPRALVVVSGFDWGSSLVGLPLCGSGGVQLENVVYGVRALRNGSPVEIHPPPDALDAIPGIADVRTRYPVLVAEWGGGDDSVSWGRTFEQSLRAAQVPDTARWGGAAGWTAWSWTDPPLLVSGGQPTAFGTVVHAALTAPAETVVPAAGIHSALTPPHWRLVLTETVGPANAANRRGDVRALQDRLVELRYLTEADREIERPLDQGPATVPAAAIERTIAAVRVVQGDAGLATDGRVTPRGKTAAALNKLVPRPTAEELNALAGALATVVAEATRGVEINEAVGKVAGGNRPADVRAVQRRLVGLGYLAADHGEMPAETTTSGVPSSQLKRTRQAIEAFRKTEVGYWVKRGIVAGGQSAEVVRPQDATHRLLDRVGSWTVRFSDGDEITFRDHVRSQYTVNLQGSSVVGIARPTALPLTEFLALGLEPAQAAALRFVSAHEGNFDALNTYDRARVSLGFIQFAGGRGLPAMLALLKATRPAAFSRWFRTYGVDIEFDVQGGAVVAPSLVLLDPTGARHRRGTVAEEAVRDSAQLSAVFIRAGRDREVQRAQIEAAGRDYLLTALRSVASHRIEVIEVLNAPDGVVVERHAGEPGRVFAATARFRQLESAGRIARRTAQSEAPISKLFVSEQGVAVLLDRAVQEGSGPRGAGVGRVVGAVRSVSDARGVVSVSDVVPYERSVLLQVVEDFSADIDIATELNRAAGALGEVVASATGATLEDLLQRPQLAQARAAVDAAVGHVARKSLTTVANHSKWRTRAVLGERLPPQRARLALEPRPATVTALIAVLGDVRTQLLALRPPGADAEVMRRRVRAILASGLGSPNPEPG